MKKKRMDPVLHCEGDTDIEDLFVTAEDVTAEEVPPPEPVKKKQPVRRGPTLRRHA